jgi:hypothetical protein
MSSNELIRRPKKRIEEIQGLEPGKGQGDTALRRAEELPCDRGRTVRITVVIGCDADSILKVLPDQRRVERDRKGLFANPALAELFSGNRVRVSALTLGEQQRAFDRGHGFSATSPGAQDV